MKRFPDTKLLWCFSLGVVLFLCSPSLSVAGRTGSDLIKPRVSSSYKKDTSRILFVIKQKVEDTKLIDKTKEKLLTLSDAEIRLIASLCDRISKNQDTAGAELAFSLVAALIMLS